MRRLVVLILVAAVIGIPVAIAKTGSSAEPQRSPAAKPALQKPAGERGPVAKQRAKVHRRGQCRDRAFRDADV